MNTPTRIAAAASLTAAASALANPTVELVRGHTDLGSNIASGEPILFFESDSDVLLNNLTPDDDPISIEDVYIRVPDSQEITRPSSSQWDFLGTPPDTTIFFLPQSRDAAVPWLGISAEELSPSFWDSVTLNIDAIDAPDGAVFSLWQAPPLAVELSTAPGFPTSLTFPAGAHTHYNWGFSDPGVYVVTITLTLTPVTGDPISSTSDVWFAVGSDTTIPTVNPCPADIDTDGTIGPDDLFILLANFGATNATPDQGDLDNDTFVGPSDLFGLLAEFGNDCP